MRVSAGAEVMTLREVAEAEEGRGMLRSLDEITCNERHES